ncbi:MAG: divalent metal cation transporter, partial [Phenylobacterium sp.]|nr:divalent metal cation transporter [Phenylobacterium sp.]
IRALFWSAVINGVIAVPLMAVIMLVATRRSIMGAFTATPVQRIVGWAAVAIMAAASGVMFAQMAGAF